MGGGGNNFLKARRGKLFYNLVFLKCIFSSKFFKLLSFLLPFTLAIHTLNAVELDSLIANKLQSCGVLTFTQKELSHSLLVGLIEKEQSFTLTNLNNRDEIIFEIENILKRKKQNYQIKTEDKTEIEHFVGITGEFDSLSNPMNFWVSTSNNVAQAVVGALLQWQIVKSLDSRVLDVVSVKDIKNEMEEEQ